MDSTKRGTDESNSKQQTMKHTSSIDPMNLNKNKQKERGGGKGSTKGKKKKELLNKKKGSGGCTNVSGGRNSKNSGDINVEPSPAASIKSVAVSSTKAKRSDGGSTDTGGGAERKKGDGKNRKGIKSNENRKSDNRKKVRIMDTNIKDRSNNNNTKNDTKKDTKNNTKNDNKNNNSNKNCTATTTATSNSTSNSSTSNSNSNSSKSNSNSNSNNINNNNINKKNTKKINNKNNNKDNNKNKKKRDGPSENNVNVDRKVGRNRRSLKKPMYPAYHDLRQCLDRIATNDPKLIRGKINVPPGGKTAFVSCDRGSLTRDVFLDGEKGRNRALNGDIVFVEIIGYVGDGGEGEIGMEGEVVNCNGKVMKDDKILVLADLMRGIDIEETQLTTRDISDGAVTNGSVCGESFPDQDEQYTKDVQYDDYDISDESSEEEIDDQFVTNVQYDNYEIPDEEQNQKQLDQYHGHNEINNKTNNEKDCTEKSDSIESDGEGEMWHDDQIQKSLWNPLVNTRKPVPLSKLPSIDTKNKNGQPIGKVVHVLAPKRFASDINTSDKRHETKPPRKTIVGTLTSLPGANNCRFLLTPSDRSLPRFMTRSGTKMKLAKDHNENENEKSDSNTTKTDNNLYRAEYIYGTWSPTDKWPPCTNLKAMGNAGNVEDETMALLAEFDIFHGPFSPQSLKDVEDVVESGRTQTADGDMGWAPTPEMLVGRRDFRSHRIFTIDPTSAKDLDDALHVRNLGDGRVEIGVHIADCSYFVKAGSSVDMEARERGTTVYLVDRTIPMLPRPLCEIACSLNENVERLAFSCVWTMNMDGNLEVDKKENPEEIWYGRSVIRSCARLDYATAQNIIDRKVANGEANRGEDIDEAYWPVARRPTGGHTIDGVAEDVRLMHKVAMARRKLRFENGALALNGVKLAFQLGDDGETPEMCSPYPIRDSNRLIEEYMLLANFLVAQRIISHANSIAQLRRHPPPKMSGIQQAVDIAKAAGFHIDTTSSRTLQKSLNKLEKECTDTLVIQCVTAMLTMPMQPARYFVGGSVKEEDWCHFALNIPYYTHFTSPIRRYPDIIVHRVLQATIDGQDAVKSFVHSEQEIGALSRHCNTKKETSRKAQERSDIVFLSIYLKAHPIHSTCAVVTSIGTKTFTVFIPSLGLNKKIFLEDHSEKYNVTVNEGSNDNNSIILYSKVGVSEPSRIDINIFSKIAVSCNCKDIAPIDVSLRIVGPWLDA